MRKEPLAFIVILFIFNSCFNCDIYLNTKIKPISIKGIVVSKDEINCFGEIILKEGFYMDTLRDVCSCTPSNQRLWDYVLPNDSLNKKAGSLIVTVIRDGQPTKEFNYPCCNQ